MISNRVYRAKEIELLERMVIKSGQELEIVMDVVYMLIWYHQTYRTYFIVILLIIQHHLMMLLKMVNGRY
jgi:hypothetical protein